MTFLIYIQSCLLLGLSICLFYLYFLMLAYLLPQKKLPLAATPVSRFAIVIPAHNEEEVIRGTLNSVLNIYYPRELFDVFVVADNCNDGTTAIVRDAGITCLERFDHINRGKGYALQHAFNNLLPQGYDAFLVVDADSIVSPDFLSVMDRRLQQGQKVIQAYYGLTNPESTPLTYLFYVGNLIENFLFYGAKERLGLPVLLRGNGMCFARSILEHYPWQAYSIVEDTEYGLKLIQAGISVHFATEVQVLAKQPETLRQALTQRLRWASGNASISKTIALRLMWKGVTKRNLALVDAAFNFFVMSKPLLLFVAFLSLLLGVVLSLTDNGNFGLYWALFLLGMQVFYLLIGIFISGLTLRHLQLLFQAPALLVWFIYVTLLGLAGVKKNQWLRTERT